MRQRLSSPRITGAHFYGAACGIRPELLLSSARQSPRKPTRYQAKCSAELHPSLDVRVRPERLGKGGAVPATILFLQNIRTSRIHRAHDATVRVTSSPSPEAGDGCLRPPSTRLPRAVRRV